MDKAPPPPEGYREATDEDYKRLPADTLFYADEDGWMPVGAEGEDLHPWFQAMFFYAVPKTNP